MKLMYLVYKKDTDLGGLEIESCVLNIYASQNLYFDTYFSMRMALMGTFLGRCYTLRTEPSLT